MENERVNLFYEEMKNSFVKSDSSWTDKGAIFRTILEKFFQELTSDLERQTTLCERIDNYYDENPEENDMRIRAHRIRRKTNEVVHNRIEIGENTVKRASLNKASIRDIYEDMVLVVYNATKVMPDNATFELLGVKPSEYLKGLNEQQKDAVLEKSRIVFVNAGPGTGKTTLLVKKMVHYIINHPQENHVVALSFTNTAAKQLEDKFQNQAFQYLKDASYELFNGTIHSFCIRKMRKYNQLKNIDFNYIIIGDDELYDMVYEIQQNLDNKYTIEQINEFLGLDSTLWPPELTSSIETIKKQNRLISLNDILTIFYERLESDKEFAEWILSSCDLLVIDEAQDLNVSNFKIFELLLKMKPSLNLFLVGDPRQNIFEFNGGAYKYLEDFLNKYPQELVMKSLSISYRCPTPVLDFVNGFEFIDCENIPLHSGREGEIVAKKFPTTEDESDYVINCVKNAQNLDSCAILSPTIKGMANIIDRLNANKVPFVVLGGRRKLKSHIQYVNNLLKVLLNYNEKSIFSVARILGLDVRTQPIGAPRHFSPKELFFKLPFGRKVRDVYSNYNRYEWSLPTLVGEIVDALLPPDLYKDDATMKDFARLKVKVASYKTIKEYLDAFTIYKERFTSFYDKDFEDSEASTDGECITISTIHSAKGLEWPNVFVIGMYELNFPGIKKYSNMHNAKQEKYLNTKKKELYVACTRTAHSLAFTYPEMVEETEQSPSRLLTGLNFE